MAGYPDYPNTSDRFSSTLPRSQGNPAGLPLSSSWGSSTPPQTPQPGLSDSAWALIGLAIVVAIGGVLLSSLVVFIGYQRAHLKRIQPHVKAVWHHESQIARQDQLVGAGRIYLIQLGPHSDPYTTVELSDWLRRKYSLDTQVLDPAPLDPATLDKSRHLYIAELVNEQIKREHPDLAADPNAFVIGFTDAAMYSATEPWSSSFSQRSHHRIAIISSSGMGDLRGENIAPSPENLYETPDSRFNDRVRRILLKDVAVLFWHLRLNNDPGSILYYILNPDVPNNDIYQSDLDPARSGWGESIDDPCVTLTYTRSLGLKPSLEQSSSGSNTLIRPCEEPENAGELQSSLDTPDSPPDTGQERIELRLREGTLTEKHTDFFLPGPVPIRFERATSNEWQMPAALGMSGSHNYDRYLVSHDDMRHITVANAGSGDDVLVRSPVGLPLLLLNKWRDTNESGSNLILRWRGGPPEHFDLTRYNGEVDSYMPCSGAELCYLDGYHNSKGETLTVQRDSLRRLTSLSAPQENSLHLSYDLRPGSQTRITQISDSHGRLVLYAYNSRGQLQNVTYPSGEVLSYTYDQTHNLLNVNATPGPNKPSAVLVTNAYENGKLISQTLADGTVYAYTYLPEKDTTNSRVTVSLPDGSLYDVALFTGGSTVRQRPRTPPPAH